MTNGKINILKNINLSLKKLRVIFCLQNSIERYFLLRMGVANVWKRAYLWLTNILTALFSKNSILSI